MTVFTPLSAGLRTCYQLNTVSRALWTTWPEVTHPAFGDLQVLWTSRSARADPSIHNT